MNTLYTILFVVGIASAVIVGCVLLHRALGYINIMHIGYISLFGVLFGSIWCAYLQENRPESFVSYQENLFPQCDWVNYIENNTQPTEFSIRKSQQPTIASGVILIQQPTGPHIYMPTTMTASASLAYILRVWVTSSCVNKLIQNNPFALVYQTATENANQALPLQFQVVYQQNTPYEALPGTQWFLLESSVIHVPPYATFVQWRLEPTLTEVHWADFQIQYKRSAQNFEPSFGLQALYSTFLPGHQLHQQQWVDESGYNAHTLFDQLPITQGKGIVIPGVWNGPLASVLTGHTSALQTPSNRVNIRDFTLSFYYTPPRNQTQQIIPLFTIYATYRNDYQYDNPPNYFLRCFINLKNNTLCVVQQTIAQGGSFVNREMCIPLRNEMNEPILYTIVVRATTRTTGDVLVFANTQLETHQTRWIDLNYDLSANANHRIIWGNLFPQPGTRWPQPPQPGTDIVGTAMTVAEPESEPDSEPEPESFEPNPYNTGVLHMFLVYNKALSVEEVGVLHRYVSRSYNVGTALHMPTTPQFYTPLSIQTQVGTDANATTPSSFNDWGENSIMSASSTGQQLPQRVPTGRTACVRFKPSHIDNDGQDESHSKATCSYVDTSQASTLCPKDTLSEDNHLLYPYANHTCKDAIAYVNQTTQNATNMGMQWGTHSSTNGFVYRSELTHSEYAQMTPTEKMNVLDDEPFNRNYRVLDDTNR